MSEAWQKHGRKGPFDWWLGCKAHPEKLEPGCISCSMAASLNANLEKELALDAPSDIYTPVEKP